ncbi:MAG: nitroreductase family protein [Melioribacteraceae bacterium]|nr:nitroreductase family protein [Melioribacteraceae bacterium]
MKEYKFSPYKNFVKYPVEMMISRSIDFYGRLKRRRTVRDYSDTKIPIQIIENCIKAAATAPNGANKQPWHFVVVSSPEIKKKIREEAEKCEAEFYNNKAPQTWLNDLEPLGTNIEKPFIEKAPYLIVVFEKKYDLDENENQLKNYYTKESVGIAAGILITALHYSGLATLTYTPSPMNFFNEVLNRPKNERAFLCIVTGLPADNAEVPDIEKKPLEEIIQIL